MCLEILGISIPETSMSLFKMLIEVIWMFLLEASLNLYINNLFDERIVYGIDLRNSAPLVCR